MVPLLRSALRYLVVPALLAIPACGGGSSAATGGVLTGRLIAERSSGNGPAPAVLGGPALDAPPPGPGDESLHSAGLADPALLVDGGLLEGRVGGPQDPLDVWRLGPAARATTLRLTLETGPRLEVLCGDEVQPAREAFVLDSAQVRDLELRAGDELILVLRGDATSRDWRLRFEDPTTLEPELRAASPATGPTLDPAGTAATLREILGLGHYHSLPGELLLRRAADADPQVLAQHLAALGYVLARRTGEVERWLRAARPPQTGDALRDELWAAGELRRVRRDLGGLAAVQENRRYTRVRLASMPQQSGVEPDDEHFKTLQWNLRLSRFPQAWSTTTGSDQVPVAVIDTGLLTGHPDLSARVSSWCYDFISDKRFSGDGDGVDADPTEPPGNEQLTYFHGTYVSGVLAASTDNKIGIAGGVWKGKLLGIRVIGWDPVAKEVGFSTDDLVQAWRYLAGLSNASGKILPVAERPKVVNMSWALDAPFGAVALAALQDLAKTGTILVSVMGNDGEVQARHRYPGALPEVIAVGAVDQNAKVTSYSNQSDYIELAAPGGVGTSVPTAVPTTWASEKQPSGYEYSYNTFQGTSVAAPLVCATIAMMESVHPGIELPTVRQILAATCVDLGTAGWDEATGFGLLDAEAAVLAAKATNKPPIATADPTQLVFFDADLKRTIQIDNLGGRLLEELAVTPKDPVSGGLGFRFEAPFAPTLLEVSVDRSRVPVGTYHDEFLLETNGGKVPFEVQYRKPIPVLPGPMSVFLLQDGEVVHSTHTDAGGAFGFEGIPTGDYQMQAGYDLDLDGSIGDSQEWYLELPLVHIQAGRVTALGELTVPWKD